MCNPIKFLVLALAFAAPHVSAETLSLCVKANGTARFAKQCNPKKETQQFVTISAKPDANPDTSGLRAITQKHEFPLGYLAERDGWVSGPLCAENEVLVSGGAELPVFADGLAIYCDAVPAQPEHGSPVSAQCSSHSLQDNETGGQPIPLTQAVEVYLSTLCAKK
jgi:hypothetical protein